MLFFYFFFFFRFGSVGWPFPGIWVTLILLNLDRWLSSTWHIWKICKSSFILFDQSFANEIGPRARTFRSISLFFFYGHNITTPDLIGSIQQESSRKHFEGHRQRRISPSAAQDLVSFLFSIYKNKLTFTIYCIITTTRRWFTPVGLGYWPSNVI